MNLDILLFFFLSNFAGQNRAIDFVIVFFAQYLSFVLFGLMVLYILFYPSPKKKKKIMIVFLATLAGIIARFGITELIRLFWHRPRPFLSHHVYQLLNETSYSFPSGHSAFFFAFSTMIYFYHKRLGYFFYVATVVMTVARVMAGAHYPSDIVGGAIVGTLSAWFTYKYIYPKLRMKQTP
jgi:undecaprenyl-diphosphatase